MRSGLVGPGRLAGRADAQVSARSRRGERRLRSSSSALLTAQDPAGAGWVRPPSRFAAAKGKRIPSGAWPAASTSSPTPTGTGSGTSPYQTFRLKLVDLLDGLLPQLEADPSYAHFLLDGQMAVVDDYLAVRPEAEERLRALATTGRMAMGPWYALPDEFLVSGRDARAQPAARPAGGGPLRRRHGRRLPARHVRPRRPDAPAAPAVRLRARRRVARRAVGHRPQRLLVDARPTAPRCGPSTSRRATATAPSCPTTPRRSSAASASSRRSRATCSPARSSG